MRVVLTGGGTGGHVTPLKPLAHELRKMGATEILYIGQKGDRFANLIEIGTDVDAVSLIKAGKYRRYPNESTLRRVLDVKTNLLNARDAFRVINSTLASRRILRKFNPDVVFGYGGYVSVPVGWAASLLGLPLVIHESDAKPGIATRLLSTQSKLILFGVPTRIKNYREKPVEYVGIPLRKEFLKNGPKEQPKLKKDLGFSHQKPLVVFSGGSLGAEAINNALLGSLDSLLDSVQIAHIAGDANVERIQNRIGADKKGYKLIGFTNEIDTYFKAADVVVTRASATTFSELAALSKATILIPGKQLSDQIENAAIMKERGAVETLDENDLAANDKLLEEAIVSLVGDSKKKESLEKTISSFAKPNASRDIAEKILSSGGRDVEETD